MMTIFSSYKTLIPPQPGRKHIDLRMDLRMCRRHTLGVMYFVLERKSVKCCKILPILGEVIMFSNAL